MAVSPFKGNAAEHSKYVRWLGRRFVPCSGELHTLKQAGYHFPDGVKVKPSKSDTKHPDELKFVVLEFPGFRPGMTVDGVFVPIDPALITN